MTWHAKAMTTSYVTAPEAGAVGQLEDDSAYPNSTTSWYFLDAADAMLPADTRVVVCLGDSITDGTASTLNGDDRWTDVMSRRLHAVDPGHIVVVNAGIGGNQVAGPAAYGTTQPFAGGPSAGARLDRDVLGLSGVSHVILFEGINDFGAANAPRRLPVANGDAQRWWSGCGPGSRAYRRGAGGHRHQQPWQRDPGLWHAWTPTPGGTR